MAQVETMTRAAVCIFAKPPVAGAVKTRLIPAVGAEQAADLAEAFLQDTLAVVQKFGRAEVVIAATTPFAREYMRNHHMWIQPEGDLGVRMEAILRRALLDHQMAFAVGADSPGLPVICLDHARRCLASYDAVLGPSKDGGFYLIGVKHCPRGLLSGIEWSKPTTMQHTISRLRQQGLSVAILPAWFDVDTEVELATLELLVAKRVIDCPHTQAVLESLRRSTISAGLGE
jgi:uncharacterized protein